MKDQPDLLKEAKLKKQKDTYTKLLYLGIGMFGIGSFMLVGQSTSEDMPAAIMVFGAVFIGIAVYKIYQMRQGK